MSASHTAGDQAGRLRLVQLDSAFPVIRKVARDIDVLPAPIPADRHVDQPVIPNELLSAHSRRRRRRHGRRRGLGTLVCQRLDPASRRSFSPRDRDRHDWPVFTSRRGCLRGRRGEVWVVGWFRRGRVGHDDGCCQRRRHRPRSINLGHGAKRLTSRQWTRDSP